MRLVGLDPERVQRGVPEGVRGGVFRGIADLHRTRGADRVSIVEELILLLALVTLWFVKAFCFLVVWAAVNSSARIQ